MPRCSSFLMSLAIAGLALPAHAQTTPGAPAPAAMPAQGAAATGDDGYQLGVADHVRITVYNEPDLSGEFTVGASGQIALPLIGDVPAQGQTPRALGADVQRRLADGYLKDPHVSVEVLTYRPFYILGEVTKPGEYPWSNDLTVMNAIATAQGYTYRANKRKVFIKHAGEDHEERVTLSPDLKIRPGDTIRVGERYF